MGILGSPDLGRKAVIPTGNWLTDLSAIEIHRCIFAKYLVWTGRLDDWAALAEIAPAPWSAEDRREWADAELADSRRGSGGGW